MAYGMELLYPSNATRILEEAQPRLLQEGGFTWLPRTPVTNSDGDEMTVRYSSRIYASDIIAEDATALVRDSGQFSAETMGTNKLKHGKRLTEKQINMLIKLKNRQFVGDNELISFDTWVSRSYRELLIGNAQRVEALINAMFLGGYDYDRLGLRAKGSFNIHSDFKGVAATPHNEANATPLQDLVAFLQNLWYKWGRQFTTITCREAWIKAVVATDEYKHQVEYSLMPFRQISDVVELRTTNYLRHADNIAALLSEQLGWTVTIEVDENVYYEYQSDGSEKPPNKFHPEEYLYFSGIPGAFDVGNGPLVEALLGDVGRGNVIGSFKNAGIYGPMGYTTLASPDLNPPGITIWVTSWQAPRLFDDKGIGNYKWK